MRDITIDAMPSTAVVVNRYYTMNQDVLQTPTELGLVSGQMSWSKPLR
jgi:hypothetical protein